jgi:hypothetical protein
VRRICCLAAFICLSLWAAGSATLPDAPDAVISSSPHTLTVLADTPSSDGTSDRRWAAVPPVACLAGSTWTSQTHHAVLARALCQSIPRAPREGRVAAASTPRPLRQPFHIPLLI